MVEMKDARGWTPLMVACRQSSLDVVKYLVTNLNANLSYICESGSPLISAIDGNKSEIVEYFIKEQGYDVNQTDTIGNSPLYIATFKGNLQLVKFLLANGADPWLKGPKGSTVLHVCAERNFLEVAQAIVSQDADKNSALVFEATEVDSEGEGKMTCLHVACEWNSIELVEYFFELGGEKLVLMKNADEMDAIEFSYAENMEAPYGYLNKQLGRSGRLIYCQIF